MADRQMNIPEAPNYHALRKLGMEHIAKLSANLWSDHNIHDPGVTILELLCFALTDLGHRTSLDIQDILTGKEKDSPDIEYAFYTAEEILPSHPITLKDYKKLILDHIPGVRNVHFETTSRKYDISQVTSGASEAMNITGFYNVFLELEDYSVLENYKDLVGRDQAGQFVGLKEFRKRYKEYYSYYVRNFLLKYRNLCEDIHEVSVLSPVEFNICVNIEIEPDAQYETIIDTMFEKIHEYVNPPLKRYSLQELLEKGKTIEEIYQGILPENGFIDCDELEHFENRKTIYSSDIIRAIMSIEGVVGVRHFRFMQPGSPDDDSIKNDGYRLTLTGAKKYFSFDHTRRKGKDRIIVTRGLLTFTPDIKNKRYAASETEDADNKLHEISLPVPESAYKGIDEYVSIQNEFPDIYKLGYRQIGHNDPVLRVAQRNQLKAYLLFFEQLLADYLTQLSSVKDIFSWKEIDYTYFTKDLSDNEIADFSTVFQTEKYAEYRNLVGDLHFEDRRNRVLNHLIARFNEEFVDYSVLEFSRKNGIPTRDFSRKEVIKDKIAFLKTYARISANRSRAMDYTRKISSINASTLEKRIYAKLGLKTEYINRNYLSPRILHEKNGVIAFRDNRSDSYNTDFGVHVYEHILFRPRKRHRANPVYPVDEFLNFYSKDNSRKRQKDPYSMQVTVVVPGWLNIASEVHFRNFVEDTVRLEVPAHIAVKVCWISPAQMYQLEIIYEEFLSCLAKEPFLEPGRQAQWEEDFSRVLQKWNAVFGSLKNIYPPARLSSGKKNYGDESAILDHSNFGTEDLFTIKVENHGTPQ